MNNQVIKPVSLEDSQVRLPLQLAQLDAENYMISITHHKQKFSFPKLTIYAGLTMIWGIEYSKDMLRFLSLFISIFISYLIWLKRDQFSH